MTKSEQDKLFRELFEAYRQPIFAYLYRLVGDLADAEDLLADVFLRAYQALPRLAAEANQRAWLYRIATNAARDLFRRRKVRQWLPFLADRDDEGAEPGEAAYPAQLGRPEDERLAVHQALQALEPAYRTPLILFSVEGLSTQEIAQVLGIGQSAVKMRLLRARAMFRSAYGAD